MSDHRGPPHPSSPLPPPFLPQAYPRPTHDRQPQPAPPISRQPLPPGALTQLARGMLYPIEGLRFIVGQRLWRLALAPALVGTLVFVVLCTLTLVLLVPSAAAWVASLSKWATDSSWLGMVAVVARIFIWIAAIAAIVLGNALVALLAGKVLASTFLDLLSERIETLVLGTAAAPLSLQRLTSTIAMAVTDLLWSLFYWALANVPILLVGLALPPVSAVLSFAVSALILALDFVGLPMERRLIPFRQRWHMLRGRRLLCLGFGSVCLLLFAIPGLSVVLLPGVTAGGTLLFCDIEAAQRRLETTHGKC